MTQATAPSPSEAGTSRARGWYVSKAPARLSPLALLITTTTSVVALLALVAAGKWLGETVLIPPLAASMALVAGASATPLGQPRNVIGGQLVSALTGYLVLAIGGAGMWTAAVAGGLALGAMLALRVGHSPAAATAVIVALSSPPIGTFLAMLALATVILIAVGMVGNRIGKQAYPVYWW
ncbi:HPP family protein [Streptomyces brevispora]|uniref:HPP family protein n=1 Tax=Streptomyces brevispora TaxID=887462 RepID=UPI0033E60771